MNKVSLLSLFIIFYILPLQANEQKRPKLTKSQQIQKKPMQQNICETQECEHIEEISLCFVDDSMFRPLNNLLHRRNCGHWAEMHYTSNIADIAEILSQVAKSCKRVKELIFFGHASKTRHRSGIELGNMQSFRHYSCLFVPNVHIDISGCNTGRGCLGDLFMYDLARNLLHENGGVVTGNTHYAIADRLGILPAISINGKKRELIYTSTSQQWNIRGIFGDTLNDRERCTQELSELLNKVQSMRNRLQRSYTSVARCASNVTERVSQEFGLNPDLKLSELYNHSNVQTAINNINRIFMNRPEDEANTLNIIDKIIAYRHLLKKEIFFLQQCDNFQRHNFRNRGYLRRLDIESSPGTR